MIFVYSILFFLPFISWYLYIMEINGYFYVSNFENYKFIIWIFENFELNGLLSTTKLILLSFMNFHINFFKEHWFLFLLLLPLKFCFKKIELNIQDVEFVSPLFFIFIYSSFFIILGHKPMDIISILLIPYCIIVAKIIKNNMKNCENKKTLILSYSIFLLPYYFWSVTKFGPYS